MERSCVSPQPVPSRADRRRRRAYVVWGVALLAYLVAVFHRSSLAVAGLAATERFDITAAQLATFTMLQLLVYAVMQVPVGLLVDRFGPRAVLITGTVLLVVAQAVFAVAATYPLALIARFFVGAGDAMTFICVLRLVNTWFSPRRVPVLIQATGVVGQSGALLAAVPMTLALRELGWTTAYLLASGVGVVIALGLLLVVRDGPDRRSARGVSLTSTQIRTSLRASWDQAGTRLGFWVHFTAQFSTASLGLLWGHPFFVRSEGVSEHVAGLLLTLLVLTFIVAGPLMGVAVSRRPWSSSTLALSVVAAIVVIWSVVLAWRGPAPLWLLVVLVLVVGLGTPASLIGFDIARGVNPGDRLASATGIVNQGGYLACLVLVVAIGLVLDWRTPGTSNDYTPVAFQWAMSCQYVLWALGTVQIVRYRRRTRRLATAHVTLSGGTVREQFG